MEKNVKKTLLIIDDDIGFVRPVQVALEEKGYNVVTAPNGDIGRQMIGQVNPDLIILDIMMPGEHGIASLEQIKGDEKTSRIPVIVSTNLEKAIPLVKEKSEGFILKSEISLPQLVRKVDNLLMIGNN